MAGEHNLYTSDKTEQVRKPTFFHGYGDGSGSNHLVVIGVSVLCILKPMLKQAFIPYFQIFSLRLSLYSLQAILYQLGL